MTGQTPYLYQRDELSKSGSYILIESMACRIAQNSGSRLCTWLFQTALGSRAITGLLSFRFSPVKICPLTHKMPTFGCRMKRWRKEAALERTIGFFGPLTTSWAHVKHVRMLKEDERDARKTTAMYRVQIWAPHCPPGIPYGYWSIDI